MVLNSSHWRCGLCRDVYETEGQADACCGYLKAIDSDPMLLDETDRREATMEAELEQARKRVAALEDAVKAALRHFERDPRDGQPKRWLEKALEGVEYLERHPLRPDRAMSALSACVTALEWGQQNCRSLTGGDERRFADALTVARSVLGGET